jgi:P27 family predicted phage terminase small subunit
MASPHPIPTRLKILRGNPGCRPLNPREPKSDKPLPKAPEYLTPPQRKAWQKFAAALRASKIACSLDATALELLCSAYAGYLDAAGRVAQAGAVWIAKTKAKDDSEFPAFAYSPYYNVMNREWKKVAEMLREFGMTPSSRTKVTEIDVGDAAALDEFERFKRRG